jgi:hypothetical protein
MKITLKKIEKLNPCKDRLENFVKHNPDFKGSVRDFLSLDTITYSDKTWVCARLMTGNQRFYWARACARSVLEIFEVRRPNDSRVRELLDYLDTIKNIEKSTSAQISKIRDLHDAAYDDAAAYAAAAYVLVQQEEYNLIILAEIMEMDI